MANYVDAVDILDALTNHLNHYLRESFDRSNSPHENNFNVRHRFEHWIAYTGSTSIEQSDGFDDFGDPVAIKVRDLEFASFVRVTDLKNDHKRALKLHLLVMSLLQGFIPDIKKDGLKSSLEFKSDTLLAPRADETTFRYQALYSIKIEANTTGIWQEPNQIRQVIVDLYNSDIGHIADPERSTLDSVLSFDTNK